MLWWYSKYTVESIEKKWVSQWDEDFVPCSILIEYCGNTFYVIEGTNTIRKQRETLLLSTGAVSTIIRFLDDWARFGVINYWWRDDDENKRDEKGVNLPHQNIQSFVDNSFTKRGKNDWRMKNTKGADFRSKKFFFPSLFFNFAFLFLTSLISLKKRHNGRRPDACKKQKNYKYRTLVISYYGIMNLSTT